MREDCDVKMNDTKDENVAMIQNTKCLRLIVGQNLHCLYATTLKVSRAVEIIVY